MFQQCKNETTVYYDCQGTYLPSHCKEMKMRKNGNKNISTAKYKITSMDEEIHSHAQQKRTKSFDVMSRA